MSKDNEILITKNKTLRKFRCEDCQHEYWVFTSDKLPKEITPCCRCEYEDTIDETHIDTYQTAEMLRGLK